MRTRRTKVASLMDHIRSNVLVNPETQCWEWQGYLQPNGYSKVSVGGKMRQTHNVVCTETHGPAPEGHEAMHSCHNRKCCAPDHLTWGTRKQNIQATVEHGSHAPSGVVGSMHGRSKLTEAQVRAIREDARPHRQIAAEYGVDKSLVSQVKRRVVWAWL